MFELKKYREVFLMTLMIDVKFEEKLICAFQNDKKNLSNFRSQTEK